MLDLSMDWFEVVTDQDTQRRQKTKEIFVSSHKYKEV